MPDEIRYEILNTPKIGRDIAASRTPRLLPTVPAEYSEMLSREVAAGEWTVDPTNGQPLSAAGQTITQHLEFTLAKRPHWLAPIEKDGDEAAEKAWLSGNITEQGQRLLHLQKYAGSKAAGEVLWREEAERYSTTPGSRTPGIKPGKKSADSGDGKKPAANLTDNPWSQHYRGDEATRTAKIASIIKTGTRFAEGLAKAAGTTIGKPLRK